MGKKKKVTIESIEEELKAQDKESAEAGDEPMVEVMEDGPSELEKSQQEARELKEEMLRMRADTDNVRKRLQREKQESVQFANEKLIKQLLPIYENLERALKAPDTNVDSLKEGVQMTSKQFLDLLKKENVEPIEAVGEKFDPSIHEVLSQIESPDHDENTVIEEYSKGYRLNGRVLLPARVVTSKKPAPAEPKDKDSDNASNETETPA